MTPFSYRLQRTFVPEANLQFSGIGYRMQRRGLFGMIPPNRRRLVEISFIYNHTPVTTTIDGKPVEVPSDTLFVWDLSCRVGYGLPDVDWTLSWLQAWGSDVEALLRRHRIPFAQPIQFPSDHDFARWIGLIRDEFDSHSTPSNEMLLHFVEGLILECKRHLNPARTAPPIPQRFQEAKRMIEERHRESLTLPELATAACMSQSHFSRSFKRHYGVSPIDYVIQVRIHSAAELLQNPQTTVQQAAYEVGYEDVFHFSKLFKKHMGVAPLHYRDSGRKTSIK